jgi:hypothetical protein
MGSAVGFFRRVWACTAVLFVWSGFLPTAFSQNLTVQSGSSFNLGSGTLDLGCGDMTVAGSLAIGSGTALTVRNVDISGGDLSLGSGLISLSGDWVNRGSFTAGTGRVNVVDGCGSALSRLAGNSDFYQLAVTSSAGRTLEAEAGSIQTFANRLTLTGTSANLLRIRSSQTGSSSFFQLAASGTQDIFAVDVADNDASGGQVLVPQPPAGAGSVDSGSNSNWFVPLVQGAVAIFTLPAPALLLLTLLLILVAMPFRHIPGRGRADHE